VAFHSLTKSRNVCSSTTGKTTSRTTPSGWASVASASSNSRLLSCDALEIVQQFALYLALCASANLMDGFDQQVDQVISQAARSEVNEGGEPSDTCCIRVTT